jgi:hypothetical protein
MSGIPNVRILLSCREFDYKYDSRFNSVNAAKVHLADPPWEAIAPLLGERGIDATQWPTEAKEVLRKPQHLKLFLDFLASGPSVHVFNTYEAMLEALFAERVTSRYGSPAVSTCEAVAAAMATSGEIWLPRLQFDAEHHNEIDQLLAAGILREDGRLLGFQSDDVRLCPGSELLQRRPRPLYLRSGAPGHPLHPTHSLGGYDLNALGSQRSLPQGSGQHLAKPVAS